MNQIPPDESGFQAETDTAAPTASEQHVEEPAFDASDRQPQDQPGLADSSQNQSRDSGITKSQAADDLPTVEDDIAAALGTDLDLSDAVPLEEVPAVSLEEQVASALERASTSLPHLSSASCSLESFKSGASNMMEQLLVAMDGMQEALTALQESRLGGERTAHDHSRTLQDLKDQLATVAMRRAQLREELRQVNRRLESQIEARLSKEAAARQAVVERKAVQVLILKRDRELAERDQQMQELQRQLGKKKGPQGKTTPPKPTAAEEMEADSPHSRGSSTWGASDDDEMEERPKPQKQASSMRQPSSVFEDNHAKLKSKGAYGGPWLFGRTQETPVPSKLELGSPRAPRPSSEMQDLSS